MSSPFDRIRAVLDSDLPKTQCWVLVVYARYDMGDGAWPSTQTVMHESRLSDGAIRKARAALVRAGLLRQDGFSYAGTKRYIVKLPEPSSATRNHVPPGGTQNQPNRNPVPPQPEPSSAKVGREGGEEEGATSPSPSRGEGNPEVEKMAKVFESNMRQHGMEGWNPDDPQAVRSVVASCGAMGLRQKKRWVEQAMRLALTRMEAA